jgi:hypothetical protein
MIAKGAFAALLVTGSVAGAAVDVTGVFGTGSNVRDVMGSYYELGLSGCYTNEYFYDQPYLGYQKEFGVFEEYSEEHTSAFRVGNTAGFVFYRGQPKLYAGFNFEYYDWRRSSVPGFHAGTDFWLPAFGALMDWRNIRLVVENLGPYGYGFKLGDGFWDNITSARAFFRVARPFAIYTVFSYERDAHEVRVIEHRGNETYEHVYTEHDSGWFLGFGPTFSF